MCIHFNCRVTSCDDVATDLVPLMPPECSQNKQDRSNACDTESSPPLGYQRHVSPVCNQRIRPSLNLDSTCSITASRVCWPACPEWQLWFIWSRSLGSDWCWKTDAVYATSGHTSAAQISNTPDVFSCSCNSAGLCGCVLLLRASFFGSCLFFLCSPAEGGVFFYPGSFKIWAAC